MCLAIKFYIQDPTPAGGWGGVFGVEMGGKGGFFRSLVGARGAFQFQCSNKIRPPPRPKQQLAAKRRHFRCLSEQQQFNFYCYDVISIRTRLVPFAVPADPGTLESQAERTHYPELSTENSEPRHQTSIPEEGFLLDDVNHIQIGVAVAR